MDRSFVLMEGLFSNFPLEEHAIQEFSMLWHRRWIAFLFYFLPICIKNIGCEIGSITTFDKECQMKYLLRHQ
jgi:hypothetical protein